MTKWYIMAGIVGLVVMGLGTTWLDAPGWFLLSVGAFAAYFVYLVGQKREKEK